MGTFKLKFKALLVVLLLMAMARSYAGTPTWTRVDYTSSTTFVGIVKINSWGYTQSFSYNPVAGDYIGAFVGTECRMIAQIFSYNDSLYVSSVIQGSDTCVTGETDCSAAGEEEVSFRLWSNSTDTEYQPVKGTTMTNPGGNIGSTDPFPIGKPNTGSSLLALSITGVTLNETFSSTTLSYTATIASASALPVASAYDIDSVSSRATSAVTVSTVANTDGTYTATITVTAEDGVTTTTYTITYTISCSLSAAPSVTTSATSACENETITATASSTTSDVTFNWYADQAMYSSLGTGSTHTLSSPTTTVYVNQSTSTSCVSSLATVTVSYDALPTTPTVTSSLDSSCVGSSVTLSASSNGTVSWYDAATGGTALSSTTITVSSSVVTYYAEATSTDGCVSSARTPVTIVPLSLPNIIASASPSGICVGETAVLSATGAVSYVWEGGSTQVSPTTTTSYSVTGVDAKGCQNAGSVSVTVNPLPLVTLTASDESICKGDSSTLTAGGAVSYAWSTTVVSGTGGAVTPDATITYSVTGTDAKGCSNTASVVVAVNTPTTVTIDNTDTDVCHDDNAITLTASIAGGVFTLEGSSTALTSFDPASVDSGSHTIIYTYTDANSCTSTAEKVFVVTEPATPVAADNSVLVNEANIALSASITDQGTITWLDASASVVGTGTAYTPSVSTATVDSYTYYVYNTLNGCVSDTITVTYSVTDCGVDQPTVNSETQTICEGESFSAFSVTSSFTTLNWYKEGETAAVQTGNGFTPTAAGTYYVTNTESCESPRTKLTVTVNSLPEITITQVDPQCLNSGSVTLSATPAGGTFSGTGVSGTTFTPTVAGSYIITYTASSNGCEASDSSTIVVNDQPSAPEVSQTTYQYEVGDEISSITVSPIIIGATITWTEGIVTATGATYTPAISSATTGTSTITVTQSVDGCESDAQTITIIVSSATCNVGLPTVATTASFCAGTSATVTASGSTGDTVQWYGPNSMTAITPASATLTTSVAGTYYVTLQNGCVGSAQAVVIKELASPSVTLEPIGPLCSNGDSAYLSVSSSLTSGTGTITASGTGCIVNTNYFDPSVGEGSYTVTYSFTSTEGCSDDSTISVQVYNTPDEPVITAIGPFCAPASFTLAATSSTTVSWKNSTGTYISSNIASLAAGTYRYYAYSVNNTCYSNADSIDVVVNAKPDAPTVTGTTTYTQGETAAALTATGTNVAWYSSCTLATNAIATGNTYTPATTAVGTLTIGATQTDTNGCTSSIACTSVIINTSTVCTTAAPTITSSASQAVCSGSSATFTSSGTDVIWYNASGDSVETGSSFTTSTAGTYYATQTLNSCESTTKSSVTLVVNAIPAAPTVTGTTAYDLGATASALTASGDNVKWYTGCTVSTSVLASSSTYTPATTTTGTVYYGATQTSTEGCESPVTCTPVTVTDPSCATAAPTITSETTQTVCSGTSAIFTASGTDIKWYNSSNTVAGTGTLFTTSTADTYTVSQTLNSCEGARATVTLVVNAVPNAPVVTSDTVCSGSTGTMTATGTDIKWYGSATSTSVLLTQTSISSSSAVSLYATQTVNSCESPRVNAVIYVQTTSAPTVTSATTQNVCSGSSATFTTSETSVVWYNSSNVSVATGSTFTTSTAGTYTADQTINGCTSTTKASVTLVVYDLPTVTITGLPDTMAKTDAAVTFSASPTGGVLSSTSAGFNQYVFTPSNANYGANAVTYTYTNSTTGCSASATASVFISLNTDELVATIATANSTLSTAVSNNLIGENAGQYPVSAQTALTEAIATATAVLTSATTQEQIDAAVTALEAAIAAFEASMNSVDRTALTSLIATATTLSGSAVIGTDAGEYPASAVTALNAAITTATAVLDDLTATQDEIDAAVVALQAAIDAFNASVVTAVTVTSVTLPTTIINLAIGESLPLTYVVAPTNATITSVVWTSSRSTAVSVDANGTITAISAGSATITVRVYTGDTYVSASLYVNALVDASEVDASELTLYPTIATDVVYIKGATGVKSVSIVSMESKANVSSFDSQADVIMINIDNLAAGTYIVSLQQADGKIVTKQFIKK